MSRPDIHGRKANLHEVRVEMNTQSYAGGMRHPGARQTEFVYVNNAYVGSRTNINDHRIPDPPQPPTTVYREQYWACSRWPYTQRILAIAVGVLLGAVIAMALSIALSGDSTDMIGGIFRSSVPDPLTRPSVPD